MGNYVTIDEEYKQKFFQLPKVFFTNEKYSNLSNNAKVVWAILRDRSSLSRKNKWFEKDTRRVFFIYTNAELCKVTNIKSETTISNIKKELENVGLIEQKRRPNRPSILYLLYPTIDENDICKIDELETALHPDDEAISHTCQGDTKSGVPKSGVPESQKLVPNDTDLNNTDKDLDTLDTAPDFYKNIFDNFYSMNEKEKTNKKIKYIETAFYDNKEYIPRKLADMLRTFSTNIDQAKKYYDIILIAKNNIEKEWGTLIWLDNEPEITQEIINAFVRSLRKIEQERDIENPRGYLYKSIYELLSTIIGERLREKLEDNEGSIYYDWTNEK